MGPFVANTCLHNFPVFSIFCAHSSYGRAPQRRDGSARDRESTGDGKDQEAPRDRGTSGKGSSGSNDSQHPSSAYPSIVPMCYSKDDGEPRLVRPGMRGTRRYPIAGRRRHGIPRQRSPERPGGRRVHDRRIVRLSPRRGLHRARDQRRRAGRAARPDRSRRTYWTDRSTGTCRGRPEPPARPVPPAQPEIEAPSDPPVPRGTASHFAGRGTRTRANRVRDVVTELSQLVRRA